VLIRWVKQPIPILAHLVPLGTPYPLIPLIVIIELVRRLIRPGTLAVRLAANMVAGHLLLTLLGSLAPTLANVALLCAITGLVLLIILECAVALIQSYVFRILITLYVEEVSSEKMN
jgi:F-type H+-transporting ATPase subunit a